MEGWPKTDANHYLFWFINGLFLTMNATDVEFQSMNSGNLISGFITLFEGLPLNIIERTAWWLHIIGTIFLIIYIIKTPTYFISFSKHIFLVA